ncbi:hypothetical protein GCM10027294_32570 [Marinactinospora endophytica]
MRAHRTQTRQLRALGEELRARGAGSRLIPADARYGPSLHGDDGIGHVTVTSCGLFFHFREPSGGWVAISADRPDECAELIVAMFARRERPWGGGDGPGPERPG